MCATLKELSDNSAVEERAKLWKEEPTEMEPEQLLNDIKAIGKGRFAQRLATRICKDICPEYIRNAIGYVARRGH